MKKLMYALVVLILTPALVWASPYAVKVVDYGGSFGDSPYDDPYSVLGKPSTDFVNLGSGTAAKIKLVEPTYNTDEDGNKLITTLNSGAYITVKFDHQVTDDPDNPYGIDFLVFGNSLYTGSGYVSDTTNMNTYTLTGGGWFESVTVSVSLDGITWYTYEKDPYGDAAFPTQGYEWDAENACWTDTEMDFIKPVDPDLADLLSGGGISAAEAIALYDGSGGGTGYDWIQYIRVEGYGGEIDAFADVSPVPVPGSFGWTGSSSGSCSWVVVSPPTPDAPVPGAFSLMAAGMERRKGR